MLVEFSGEAGGVNGRYSFNSGAGPTGDGTYNYYYHKEFTQFHIVHSAANGWEIYSDPSGTVYAGESVVTPAYVGTWTLGLGSAPLPVVTAVVGPDNPSSSSSSSST
jgi:hypothetical protein